MTLGELRPGMLGLKSVLFLLLILVSVQPEVKEPIKGEAAKYIHQEGSNLSLTAIPAITIIFFMARPLRIEYPCAWYHVMNKGAKRSRVFSVKDDYQMFTNLLKESCNLFNVSISAYCLMPNHYHILFVTPDGNLSRFMRHVNGVYTQRYNRKHNKDGPLFRGRYKAILIQENEYLNGVVRYIHSNPIKAKFARNITEYKWSSHGFYLKGKTGEDWLDIDSILISYSKNRKQAVKAYKNFIGEGVDDELESFYSKKNQSSILGDKVFIKKIQNKFIHSEKKTDLEIKEKRTIRGERTVERINIEVRKIFKIKKERLYQSKRGEENIPRLLAITLSRELSGLGFPDIARMYKISSYRTVGTSCYRFNERLKKNNMLAKQYKKLKSTCSKGTI